MTATSQASRVITPLRHPTWCEEDLPCGRHEILHCRDLPETWGADGEEGRLRLGLERQDDEDGAGIAHLSVQYLPNGRTVDCTASVALDDGPAIALRLLELTSTGTGVSVAALLADLLAAELKKTKRPDA
jgi:hypothetical protein